MNRWLKIPKSKFYQKMLLTIGRLSDISVSAPAKHENQELQKPNGAHVDINWDDKQMLIH